MKKIFWLILVMTFSLEGFSEPNDHDKEESVQEIEDVLLVEGELVDVDAPTVHSVQVMTPKVRAGAKVRIRVHATDNLSGVSSISATFFGSGYQSIIFSEFEDEGDGFYLLSSRVIQTDASLGAYRPGVYKGEIRVMDSADQWTKSPELKFTILGEEKVIPDVENQESVNTLVNFTRGEGSFEAGGESKVRFQVSGPTPRSLSGDFVSQSGESKIDFVSVSPTYLGDDWYEVTLDIPPYVEGGWYVLDYVLMGNSEYGRTDYDSRAFSFWKREYEEVEVASEVTDVGEQHMEKDTEDSSLTSILISLLPSWGDGEKVEEESHSSDQESSKRAWGIEIVQREESVDLVPPELDQFLAANTCTPDLRGSAVFRIKLAENEVSGLDSVSGRFESKSGLSSIYFNTIYSSDLRSLGEGWYEISGVELGRWIELTEYRLDSLNLEDKAGNTIRLVGEYDYKIEVKKYSDVESTCVSAASSDRTQKGNLTGEVVTTPPATNELPFGTGEVAPAN